jgi:hypothetical protein
MVTYLPLAEIIGKSKKSEQAMLDKMGNITMKTTPLYRGFFTYSVDPVILSKIKNIR